MNAEVKAGYKLTELGLMPGDWSLGCLGNICDVRDGTHDSPKLLKKGVPFVTSKNIVDGKLDLNDVSYISEEDAAEINKRSKVDENDIIMAMIGTIGTAARIDVEPNFCIKNVALLKPKSINSQFIFQLICSPLYQAYINDNLDGGIQKFVSLGTLRSLHVPMPDMYEQCAIATVLSDMDDLISGLDQLIAKKRDIKQATMQQLLTGQTRLPGFSGEWDAKKLGELLEYEQPTKYLVTSSEYDDNNDVPVLTAGKTFILGYTNEENGIFDSLPVIIFDDFTTAKKYVTFPFKAKSSAMKILKPRDPTVNLRLVFEIMQLIEFKLGDHKRYWISEYQNICLNIPGEEEQSAIASVLADMESELSALEARRGKAIQIKQGMMQELLTGRIRLV